MGQQHRVRAKRQRRKAYVERKRAANKARQQHPTKARAKKAPAPAAG